MGVSLFAALSLFISACSSAPKNAEEQTAQGKNSDFLGCEVTDVGGVDDKSFNQTAWKGLQDAQKDLGIQAKVLESQSPNDFEPNITAAIQQNCDLIVTVGFLLGDATAQAAKQNPDQKFAIVDFNFTTKSGKDLTYDNVRELTFATDEAAFLAGYLAAGMSKTGKVGTFGGINIPTVSIFMNGFAAGVQYYNQQNNKDVKVLGWDLEKQDGLFSGDFEDQDKGKRITENLLSEGADIIMPVAGPVGLGSAAAVEQAGDASLIWVDTDGCVSAPEYCDIFLTSVMKNMDVAVHDTTEQTVDGQFQGGLYVGTLENQGVGIAPYHEFEAKVPSDLKSQIDDLRRKIIAGEIDVAG
jgi:basic membrane protein A